MTPRRVGWVTFIALAIVVLAGEALESAFNPARVLLRIAFAALVGLAFTAGLIVHQRWRNRQP